MLSDLIVEKDSPLKSKKILKSFSFFKILKLLPKDWHLCFLIHRAICSESHEVGYEIIHCHTLFLQ